MRDAGTLATGSGRRTARAASRPYLAVALGVAALGWACHRVTGAATFAAAAWAGAAATAALAWFFRDPERRVHRRANVVLAPADGTVRRIHGSGRGRRTVEIFLAVWNVHVQRAPVDGVVLGTAHRAGAFRMAFDDRAGSRNTRCTTTLRTRRGTMKLVQVAGAVARKVECWVRPGERVRQGERIGIIHLGSQVRMTVPPGARLLVRRGSAVRGGLTRIAAWR